jgi:hypothetical protein
VHGPDFFLNKVCDIWREEDNLSPIFTNSPLVKKLLTPVQLKLPLPNLFLKYATKEHICTIGPWNQSAFERLSRVLQIFQAPFEVPKETAIQFMEDVLAKGVDFSIFGDDIVSHFTSARDVWPEVLDILLQHTPSMLFLWNRIYLLSDLFQGSVYESVFQTRANSTAMHNCLGIRPETRSCVRKTAAVLMKYAPKLLNTYDGQGRTPLMEAIERNTYSTSEEFVTKLSLAIAVLLEQPGKCRDSS